MVSNFTLYEITRHGCSLHYHDCMKDLDLVVLASQPGAYYKFRKTPPDAPDVPQQITSDRCKVGTLPNRIRPDLFRKPQLENVRHCK